MDLAQLNDHGAASWTHHEDKHKVGDTVNVLGEEASQKLTRFQEQGIPGA